MASPDKPSIPARALTHAGVFHADDVFAAALLTMLRPDIEVIRSNAVPDGFEGIVFDIGGGDFDHHWGNLRHRENGVPYSSFGLLWERYGAELLCEEDARAVDEELVQPIDLTDNTGEPNPITRCVQDFNPQAAASLSDFDEPFREAVTWACGVLGRRVSAYTYSRSGTEYLHTRMEEGDGRTLVLDHVVPWKQEVVGSGYSFVVYPSLRGGYNVQGVPISLDDPELVRPFPEGWRGADADTLARLTGVGSLSFCHPSGFLCAVGSLEDALRVSDLASR